MCKLNIEINELSNCLKQQEMANWFLLSIMNCKYYEWFLNDFCYIICNIVRLFWTNFLHLADIFCSFFYFSNSFHFPICLHFYICYIIYFKLNKIYKLNTEINELSNCLKRQETANWLLLSFMNRKYYEWFLNNFCYIICNIVRNIQIKIKYRDQWIIELLETARND